MTKSPYDPVLIYGAHMFSAGGTMYDEAIESDDEGTLFYDFIELLNDDASVFIAVELLDRRENGQSITEGSMP